MMRNKWKIFEKMTEDLNYDLFRGPKWLGNWASGADIQYISKISSNWHVNQDWCETSGHFLFRKLPKTGILTYFGAQSGPKIGLLKPIFVTPLKALAMRMSNNTDVKPVKTYKEMTKDRNFYLFWAPNWPLKIWPLRPIFHAHISKITCDEHVKQYWCETSENVLRKWPKSWAEHIKQTWCEFRENFWKNIRKPEFRLICRPKLTQKCFTYLQK